MPADDTRPTQGKGSDGQTGRPFVTIAIPALNEERYIAEAILTVVPDAAAFDYEILVLDGGSVDRTADEVRRLAASIPQLKLVHNENRTQSAAVNLAARIADPRARFIVRADSHATYPAGFVETCLSRLAETGAGSVVVTMRTVGTACFQKGVAAAQNSLLGNGGSAHRRKAKSGYVAHGHHAAFDRSLFERVGGYDESLGTNEDFDLDFRFAQTGERIWLETSIPITYFPRQTPGSLFRQYVRYGHGRAITFLRHRYRLALRQMAPVGIVLSLAAGTVLAILADARFAALPVSYAAICLGWGLARALRDREPCLLSMGVAAMIMHTAWGLGFLRGLVAGSPDAAAKKASELALNAGK